MTLSSEYNNLIITLQELIDKKPRSSPEKEAHFPAALGLVGYHLPLEILIAAGISFTLLGSDSNPVDPANGSLQTFACAQVRSILAQGYRQELSGYDGIIFGHSCDSIRSLAGIWRELFPDQSQFYFRYPNVLGASGSQDFLVHECKRFISWLGTVIGVQCPEKDLGPALHLTRTLKELLGELIQDYGRSRLPLPYSPVLNLYQAALSCDPTIVIDLIRQLKVSVSELSEQEQVRHQDHGSLVRVLISGTRFDPRLAQDIEDCGGWIVGDDVAWGLRFFLGQSAPNSGKSPVDVVARNLLKGIPNAFSYDPHRQRVKHIRDMVATRYAQGVIWAQYKFCESSSFDYPVIRNALQQVGIPMLHLELDTDYSAGREQLKNRISTFFEIINYIGPGE